jgi:hypothetical protein
MELILRDFVLWMEILENLADDEQQRQMGEI